MFTDFLRKLFDCRACQARDYHIASLKELLHEKDHELALLNAHILTLEGTQQDIIRHMTGMNRGSQNQHIPEDRKITSMPRPTGLQGKIRRAEELESASPEVLSRRKEYNERIDKILKPEIEVRDDAV